MLTTEILEVNEEMTEDRSLDWWLNPLIDMPLQEKCLALHEALTDAEKEAACEWRQL